MVYSLILTHLNMNKETLESYLRDGKSYNQISKTINKSIGTVKYWAKKYGLNSPNTKFGPKNYGETKYCPSCETFHPLSNFYNRRGKEGAYAYCKNCTKIKSNSLARDFKAKLVEYKGGACQICNYNRCQDALDFHHLDPSEKDFTIANYKGKILNDTIKKELDKCILVCANCHREIHSSFIQV